MVTPEKPPMRKSEMPFIASGTRVMTVSMPALNSAETAIPASTTVMREAPVRLDRPFISNTPVRAPPKAATGA